jgi:hypothetical protein
MTNGGTNEFNSNVIFSFRSGRQLTNCVNGLPLWLVLSFIIINYFLEIFAMFLTFSNIGAGMIELIQMCPMLGIATVPPELVNVQRI